MKSVARSLSIVALLAALVLVVWFALRPEPVSVVVHRLGRGVVEETIVNSRAGTVRARRRAELSTGTSGIVEELSVRRGDRVAAGDVLLRLDDATQRAALESAQRDEEVAQAVLARACLASERARREHERYVELSGTIVSDDTIDALASARAVAEAECDVARAEVARAGAAVAAARTELDKTTLRAPFDAIVAVVDCELGEWVTPSVPLMAAPTLIDAIDPRSLYVSAPMDEVDAAALAVDLPARVTLDPYPDREFPARVVRVAPFVLDVEQQNRTLEIEVELEDAAFSSRLLPGTTADVVVVRDARPDVLRIPTLALLEGGRVLVVADEVVEERTPTLGVRSWEWVEVVDGLAEGDAVVTSLDREGLEVGARVRVDQVRDP